MERFLLILLLTGLAFPAQAAKVRVAASNSDLGYLCERVAGDLASVESLSSGDQDPHMVDPRPSMVAKIRRADLLLRVGLDIDMWVDSLLGAGKNPRVVYGSPGYVDASVNIPLLQVPKDKVDGSMGDLHIFGNPHYWLDPANGKVMARNIRDGLCRVRPEDCPAFDANLSRLEGELGAALKRWEKTLSPYEGAGIVTYHNSWVYFARRFNLKLLGTLEPKPGVPPSPAHLDRLIKDMASGNARAILVESYFPTKGARKVAATTGAEVLVVPSSAGGQPGVKTYFDLFDAIVGSLARALASPSGAPSCSKESPCSN
ncbi:MAG: metal ABC transporter substrate-binding protein [Elusimicrobiota bacterium]|jgi:ABC-type Zn uptake system ZnuABC Zn-binding protein ZnuA